MEGNKLATFMRLSHTSTYFTFNITAVIEFALATFDFLFNDCSISPTATQLSATVRPDGTDIALSEKKYPNLRYLILIHKRALCAPRRLHIFQSSRKLRTEFLTNHPAITRCSSAIPGRLRFSYEIFKWPIVEFLYRPNTSTWVGSWKRSLNTDITNPLFVEKERLKYFRCN